MEILTLSEILKAVNGEIILKGNIDKFNSICTDTRKIKSGDLFIALKGDNFNGNDFIEKAVESGAALCIADEIKFNLNNITDAWIIKVKDTKQALLDLAKYYRSRLNTKIIGITGSTGKTSTKDLTAAALGSRYKVFKTKGNFNNEIGLPLMIFSLDNSYDIAVLEMGMNNLEEIHRMAEAARPDAAIITNVGITHIENLKTQENILKAKLEITNFFNKESLLIINADSPMLRDMDYKKSRLITTGIEGENNYKAYDIVLLDTSVRFKLELNGEKFPEEFQIEVPGKHTINNALLAIACSMEYGVSLDEINKGFRELEKTSMRLDIIKGKYTIINDCYNANPDSMKSGLEVLNNFKCNRRIAILGSMGELGDKSKESHKMIGEFAKKSNVDFLITLGIYNEEFKQGFGENCLCFEDYDEAVNAAKAILKEGDVVIVKASRSMKFEKIVDKLKEHNVGVTYNG